MTDRTSTDHLLMSSSRIIRTITRIAYQIFEDTRGIGEPVIIGINERGFKLAELLSAKLTKIYQSPVRAHELQINPDTGKTGPSVKSPETGKTGPSVKSPESLPSLKGKKVVIVDDVMYSGKTMYHALQYVDRHDRPEEIKLAALIDRGHRRYPVNIQYLGLYCPTKLKEHVQCRFLKSGDPDGVWLER